MQGGCRELTGCWEVDILAVSCYRDKVIRQLSQAEPGPDTADQPTGLAVQTHMHRLPLTTEGRGCMPAGVQARRTRSTLTEEGSTINELSDHEIQRMPMPSSGGTERSLVRYIR